VSIRIVRSPHDPVFLAAAVLLIVAGVTAAPNQDSQSRSKPALPLSTANRAGVDIEFIGSKEGANFESYLKTVYVSVKRSFFSDLPDSFVKGEKGIVVAGFQIQRDGSLSEKSLQIISGSGKKDMDEAALRAIRISAPFAPLPEAYPKANVSLQLRFFYNTPLN